MENTTYSNSSIGTHGYWLESAKSTEKDTAFYIFSFYRDVSNDPVNSTSNAVRPAIEVLKTDMDY